MQKFINKLKKLGDITCVIFGFVGLLISAAIMAGVLYLCVVAGTLLQ